MCKVGFQLSQNAAYLIPSTFMHTGTDTLICHYAPCLQYD